ncbi:MAG: amidase [Acidobacteria bacterium]|nr:amidase [Acidobacteriota bacterium]
MAGVDESVFWLSITELNAKLRAKEFSCVELTRAFCDRLERYAPRYNALALTLREEALKKAKDVDSEIKKDRLRGPLQGVPYGAKDLLAYPNHPTTWGAKPYAGQVFDQPATVLHKLDSAGAVLIGKLSMVELAGGGGYMYPAASLQGPGLNPWDTSKWSGGSSSGSGSAVAAGLTTYAIGSETSGSILTPAAYCGLTGLRPTYGLVSRAGAMALSWTLDKIGPMCRSVEDCGLVLQAISGKDAADPASSGKSYYYAPQYTRKFSDLKIGFAPSDWDSGLAADVKAPLQAALKEFQGMGFQWKEVELPDFPYGPVLSMVLGGEAGSIFEELITSGKVDELADQNQIAGLKSYLDISARDYLNAMRVRSLIQAEIRKMFYDVDLIITPTRTTVASGARDPLRRAPAASSTPPTPPPPASPAKRGLRDHVPAMNLAGLPALTMPCGFAANLPLGVSLITRPFNENALVAVGREYQARTGWHKQHPKVG